MLEILAKQKALLPASRIPVHSGVKRDQQSHREIVNLHVVITT